MYWIEFIISAALIVVAGIRLTRYADQLSDQLGWGKIWIGIVLLGIVTSLPEGITSLVSVISLKANDLAVGNLVGSNTFNPMLIVVMDMAYRKGSITNAIDLKRSHTVSWIFASLLTLIVMGDILLQMVVEKNISVGPLSLGTLLIAVVYFWGMRILGRQGTQPHGENLQENNRERQASILILGVKLGICAVFVILGAIWLANSGDQIAVQTGLGRTFVGTIFLAFVTSLPEMVVSLSALKLGSLDLAVGNIFGSNMTNLFVVFLCGWAHTSGPILKTVSPTHVFTGILSLLLMGIIILGIQSKNKKTVLHLGWDSIIMLILFLAGTNVLYQWRS